MYGDNLMHFSHFYLSGADPHEKVSLRKIDGYIIDVFGMDYNHDPFHYF